MMNLIVALFRGPFWVQLALAAALVWFGVFVQQDEANRQIARAALLEQAPPATISLADAKPGEPSRVPVELSVSAQVALDHNTRLVRKTNFVKTGEDLLYVLVDPEASADTNVAQAGIVIDPDQLDAFAGWLDQNATDSGAAGPIVTINGLLASSASNSHARDAMTNQGMVIAPDFFFIEPFIKGREASLAAIPNSAAQISWPIFGAAALMALIGVVKLRRGGRRSPPKADPVPAGRGPGGYAEAEMQAGGMLPAGGAVKVATQPASAKRPKSKTALLVWLVVGAAVIAAMMGQSWATMLMPFAVLGVMFLGLRNGIRQLSSGLDGVFGKNKTTSSSEQAAPAGLAQSSLPGWAAVQKGEPASMAAASTGPIRPAAGPLSGRDGKSDGPIRPGFSWSDLLPRPKAKSGAGPDPFERLAQQRQRENDAAVRQ